jgi:threonine/homoserine/homoserine lactone efflux protein
MASALAAGILLGLSAGFAPGPLLTLVIAQTLKHNAREGIKVAAAPLITDLPIIALSLLVLSRLAEFDRILGLISFAGGVYILCLSYKNFRTGAANPKKSEDQPQSLKKGFLVNALSPHPYLFWVTVGGPFVLKTAESSKLATLMFISCFYLLLIGSKIFLAWLAGKSRAFLTGKAYLYINRALATMLAFFALLLIRDSFVFLEIFQQ